jgi:PAS domain S-box-containing protein
MKKEKIKSKKVNKKSGRKQKLLMHAHLAKHEGYKYLFDCAVDGFFVSTRNGIYIDANKKSCKMLGRSLKGIVGKHFTELMTEEVRKEARKGHRELCKKGKTRGERIFLRKDGSLLYVDLKARQFNVGNRRYYISMIRDISKRKKYQWELEERNKSLNTLLEIDNILGSTQETDKALKLILDKTVKFTDSDAGSLVLVEGGNLVIKYMKGYRREDITPGVTFRKGIVKTAVENKESLYVPDTRKDKRVVKLVIPARSEVAIPLKVKGKVIGVLDLESKKVDNYSKFKPYLNLLTKHISMVIENSRLVDEVSDFNERLQDEVYQATKELRIKNLELQRLDQLKSDFVSSVSHELRTPLTSVAGYAKVLHRGKQGELTEDQKDSLNIIIEEAERLTRLINDVLDLSKLETGRIRFKLEKVNLVERLKQCVDVVKASAQESGIKLTLKTSKSLPLINGNNDLLGQVFMNLLSNALKFTDKGGFISILVRKKDGYLRTIVKDNGCGISNEMLPKLFNKFYQADMSMSRKHGGTGLGLPIVKHIVQIHKGNIVVESEVGKGSSFIIDLPLER